MLARCAGINLAWHEVGYGPPLLLLHGIGDDHRDWRYLLPFLALRNRVILMDLRGHGGSSLGDADGSLAQLAADVICLLDNLEIGQCVIAGFSLGGTVTMRVALDWPDRVSAIAPIATSARVNALARDWYLAQARLAETDPEALAESVRQNTNDLLVGRDKFWARGKRASLDTSPLLDELLEVRSRTFTDPAGFGNACRAMAGLFASPLTPEIERVQCRVLVVAGEEDLACPPRASEEIATAIFASRLAIVGRANHLLLLTHAAEVAALIGSLIDDAHEETSGL